MITSIIITNVVLRNTIIVATIIIIITTIIMIMIIAIVLVKTTGECVEVGDVNYVFSKLYRHHNHISCKVVALVTCSGPTNSREVFKGSFVASFSHMVDIS